MFCQATGAQDTASALQLLNAMGALLNGAASSSSSINCPASNSSNATTTSAADLRLDFLNTLSSITSNSQDLSATNTLSLSQSLASLTETPGQLGPDAVNASTTILLAVISAFGTGNAGGATDPQVRFSFDSPFSFPTFSDHLSPRCCIVDSIDCGISSK